MKKRTKIIATLGPSTESVEKIYELITAGANVFRLNFSHGTYEYHEMLLQNIKEASRKSKMIVGVLQDISGPKIRVGELEEDFELQEGDSLGFVKEEILGRRIDANHYEVCINYPHILSQLQIGDYIYLYDGIIRTKVVAIEDERVSVLVQNSGTLSSKKGVNFPNTRLNVDVLTEKDKKDIEWGVKHGVDFMAISFIQNERDILNARALVKEFGGKQMLIAKIEKFDAVENIDAILEVSDGLMVARGDLGIEVPYYEVPNIQKMLISKANAASKPVITATQMLLSMRYSQRATRAEISDIANAVLDGTDAVMLSEESAVGEFPALSVKTMFETIVETERNYPYYKFGYEHNDMTNAVDESAVRLSRDIDVSGILSLTNSGTSARKLAKYRPAKPIYAITHDEGVRQQLTLSWGIIPAFWVEKCSLSQTVSEVIKKGLKDGVISLKKSYILTAGDPVGVSGSINTIRVLQEHEMEFFENI